MSDANDSKDSSKNTLDEAKQCYSMSKGWAFLEALMSNNKLNYRTPQERLEVKDACFDSVIRTSAPAVPQDEVQRARNEARKLASR